MGVYRKILVPLDCSEFDDAIICHVALLAKAENSAVVLTRVVHSHTLDQDRILREKALACLDNRRTELEAQGIRTESRILSGEPEAELLKEINEGDYDLVAMATHGHKLAADILLGSVSDHLKHRVDIPILLVRGNRCRDSSEA